jgi:hypothetical protein
VKKLELRDIEINIHVILMCLPKTDRSAGGWRSEQVVRAATAKIMEIFRHSVVLLPDQVVTDRGSALHPVSYGPGQFGVTEPWPFEPGCRPPTTPKPPGRGNAG